MHTQICSHTHTNMHTHAHKHAHTRTHTHALTHSHVYIHTSCTLWYLLLPDESQDGWWPGLQLWKLKNHCESLKLTSAPGKLFDNLKSSSLVLLSLFVVQFVVVVVVFVALVVVVAVVYVAVVVIVVVVLAFIVKPRLEIQNTKLSKLSKQDLKFRI